MKHYPSPLHALAGLALCLALAGCTADRVAPDPARSADLARSAAGAASTPGHELEAERELRPREPRPRPAGLRAALASPERLPGDRPRDELRRPEPVLEFFGVRQGMQVLDLFAGGGYYSEIVARLVGAEGGVTAYNDAAFERPARTEIAERFEPGRLPNVRVLKAEPDALELPERRFDAALLILAWHEMYRSKDRGRPAPEVRADFLDEVYAALKPGAVLGVIDHAAAAGTPSDRAAALHRIDPGRLRQDMVAAGFVLEADSDVLRNPADDRSLSVFDPAVRGQTDQVVLRFRKPR